jgi:cyclic pyranopterin phosphate synthase
VRANSRFERWHTGAAALMPQLVRPEPRLIHLAVTSYCNLRCAGCRYGRDFMSNTELPWPIVRQLLDDARSVGVYSIRFYGGEPLLHRDLTAMIRHARNLGLNTYVTTNGILLEECLDDLYEAGLRRITIGYYGTGGKYDSYVHGKERYKRLEAGIAALRQRYGTQIDVCISWLLMRPSCNRDDLLAAWNFALKYNLRIAIDLIHYSLPYFSEGPDRELQFRQEDRAQIEDVVSQLLVLKNQRPDMILQSVSGLRSIPEWLMKQAGMRVPCHANQMLWVGSDGTVQLCYVTFKLGNLHEQRLTTMLFNAKHRNACRDAFAVNCPNCHCGYDVRVLRHGPTLARYHT